MLVPLHGWTEARSGSARGRAAALTLESICSRDEGEGEDGREETHVDE
jgi:hypothetical protein